MQMGPRVAAESHLVIRELKCLNLTERDWTIFYSSAQARGDETALVDDPARWESRDKNRQQLRGASHEFVLHCCSSMSAVLSTCFQR